MSGEINKRKRIHLFAILAMILVVGSVVMVVILGRDTKTDNTEEVNIEMDFEDTLEYLKNASEGDYLSFGTYEQDNDFDNGAEPIEWIVLEKKAGKVLLLSRYALDTKPFNDQITVEFTWEDCTLRTWLNDEFYCTAFSEDERTVIKESLLKNEGNSNYAIIDGNDTKDKVFILSFEEVTTYFDQDPDREDLRRSAKVTEYAKALGGFYYPKDDEYADYGRQWLRSTQHIENSHYYTVMGIIYDGLVTQVGYAANHENITVRPAIWVEID